MRNKLMFVLSPIILMATYSTCFCEVLQFPNGFHNGGTGACEYCHSRTTTIAAQAKPAPFKSNSSATVGQSAPVNGTLSQTMLNGADPSSTCLLCHAAPAGQNQPSGYYIATNKADLTAGNPPIQLSPAGDFGWLLKDYTWSTQESGINNELSLGERHGHNIVAQQFGYEADITHSTAPGSKYPAGKLACTSCHDPHGTYRRPTDGNISTIGPPIKASGSYSSSPAPNADSAVGTYRMLAGKGYQPKSVTGDFAFEADPPSAVAPVMYNRAEILSDTRIAYGIGMSEWCSNCHRNAHKGGGHPTGPLGRLSQSVINTYNKNIFSGKLSGTKSNSFTSLVPFESGTRDYTMLKAIANSDGSDRNGPGAGSNVMCLTCHRAHASGWDYIARWNLKSTMLQHDGEFAGTDNKAPASVAQGRTAAESRKAYFDRPSTVFGPFQKGLCIKCHDKD